MRKTVLILALAAALAGCGGGDGNGDNGGVAGSGGTGNHGGSGGTAGTGGTGGNNTGGTGGSNTGGTGGSAPCPDADDDGVCDEDDACPGADDAIADPDHDGICGDADPCLGADNDHDSDEDGTCDDADACPGSDDREDEDGDGAPDACDLCPGAADGDDSDGDGVPDGCDACPAEANGPDFDGDGNGDLCNDACIGDDASGDSDLDGVCDSNDICEGNDRLESCPWLPGHAGGSTSEYTCPLGSWVQGITTRYDGNDDPLGLMLLCRGEDGSVEQVGEWGAVAEGAPDTTTWCSEDEDAEVVGQYVGVGPLFTDSRYIAGLGLLCRSSTTGATWTIAPHKAPLGEFRNPCDGDGEKVVGMRIRTGWLIDDVQFKCGVIHEPNP